METHPLHPLHEEAEWLEQHCRLAVHVGRARLEKRSPSTHPFAQMFQHWQEFSGRKIVDQSEIEFDASFLVPAAGNCLIFLRNQSDVRLNRIFGEGLVIVGESPDGAFELNCPTYYVEAVCPHRENPAWAVASPVNCVAHISYGEPRAIAKVVATINNFEFDSGNAPSNASEPYEHDLLRVEAAGHIIDFYPRNNRQRLKRMLDIGLLHSTALTTFSFAAWEGATIDDLAQFANNVASLCSVVARQHTGIPVLTFLDGEGRVVKRRLANAVESEFRAGYILRFLQLDDGLPKLFRQCFDAHVRMQESEVWKTMPSHCAGVEDPPYLEQKLATLMAAVELFVRGSLVESGRQTPAEAERLMLPELIGAARRLLGWQIPGHYTAKDRHRLLRNAVAHGGQLPGDIKHVRHDFDKWHLFLMRRYLLRLGFDGLVASPQKGYASQSHVGDFSEEHNSFVT